MTNSGFRLTIFAAFDVRAGSDTITVTFSAAPATESHLYAHEYAGLVAFDVGAGATGTSAATDGVASGFITTRYANELLFAYSQTGVGGRATRPRATRLGCSTSLSCDATAAAVSNEIAMSARGVWRPKPML